MPKSIQGISTSPTNELGHDFKGGVNWLDSPWSQALKENNQCVMLQNLTYHNQTVETILGTIKHHGTNLGYPITAIMPYYSDQSNQFKLLVAANDSIYVRDPQANEFTQLISGLHPNGIFSSTIRYDVMYIASQFDGLKKFLGGTTIENVGGGNTAPGSFRQILYMKEVDRLFGISDDAILGQISWCNLDPTTGAGDPETWDGANIERFKLENGERVEGGGTLYGKLIIFNTYSIWIFYVQGNEENWRLEQAPTTIGCVAPNTIRRVANELWFLGEGPHNELGIYAFNGSTCRLLSYDMSPFFKLANYDNIRNACAEVHDDVYRVSLATGFSVVNNASLDFDLIHIKQDGTPAIYGPHNFAFYSSAALNGRQNRKEWIIGNEAGWVLKEGGQTLNSTTGLDGELLQQRFLSRIDNNQEMDIMKQLELVSVFFRPTGYFSASVNYYLGYGSFQNTFNMNPDTSWVGFAGDFNIFFNHFEGTPQLYEFQDFPGMNARGTAIQIEIINSVVGSRLSFDSIKTQFRGLYENRRVQTYAY